MSIVEALAEPGASAAGFRMTDEEFDAHVLDQFKHGLETQGFAVINDVLPVGECELRIGEIWDWLETATQYRVDRNDPLTWSPSNWLITTHGIVQHYGIGNSMACKKVRTAKRVLRVFELMYGTKRLVSSMDGLAVVPAPETRIQAVEDFNLARDPDAARIKKPVWPKTGKWLHADQSPGAKGRACVQGLLNLRAADHESATLCVVPGSHLKHDSLTEEHKVNRANNKHWYKFTEAELSRIYATDFERVTGPAGSIFLWDSRTVHQNSAPEKNRANKADRFVIYTCFGPEEWMSPAEQKTKVKYALEGRTTAHWPWQSTVFGKSPRTYGREDIPPVTEQGPALLDATSEALWKCLTCQTPWPIATLQSETRPALEIQRHPVRMEPMKRQASEASSNCKSASKTGPPAKQLKTSLEQSGTV